jgi:hypothetical protein
MVDVKFAILKSIRSDKSGTFNMAHLSGANEVLDTDEVEVQYKQITSSLKTILKALKETGRNFIFFFDNID